MSLASRWILLICSVVAAYFATLLGSAMGAFITSNWTIATRDTFNGLWSVTLWIVTLIVFVAGLYFSMIATIHAVTRHVSERDSMDIQELSTYAALAAILLCFVYGAVDWPNATTWYLDKWNLILVLAFTPSVFVLEQVGFNMISTRVVQDPPDNVRPIKSSANHN